MAKCKATLKDGRPCPYEAKEDSPYCGVHKSWASKTIDSKKKVKASSSSAEHESGKTSKKTKTPNETTTPVDENIGYTVDQFRKKLIELIELFIKKQGVKTAVIGQVLFEVIVSDAYGALKDSAGMDHIFPPVKEKTLNDLIAIWKEEKSLDSCILLLPHLVNKTSPLEIVDLLGYCDKTKENHVMEGDSWMIEAPPLIDYPIVYYEMVYDIKTPQGAELYFGFIQGELYSISINNADKAQYIYTDLARQLKNYYNKTYRHATEAQRKRHFDDFMRLVDLLWEKHIN